MYSHHAKNPKPKQKKRDSSIEKYSQTTINRSTQDLSEKIKRYISSLEKNCNKSYIDEYITSLKDQISGLKSEVIFLRKELNNKNELATLLTAVKSSSNINGISSLETTCYKDNRDKKFKCESLTSEQNKSKNIQNLKVVHRNQTNSADITVNDVSMFSKGNNDNNTPVASKYRVDIRRRA